MTFFTIYNTVPFPALNCRAASALCKHNWALWFGEVLIIIFISDQHQQHGPVDININPDSTSRNDLIKSKRHK